MSSPFISVTTAVDRRMAYSLCSRMNKLRDSVIRLKAQLPSVVPRIGLESPKPHLIFLLSGEDLETHHPPLLSGGLREPPGFRRWCEHPLVHVASCSLHLFWVVVPLFSGLQICLMYWLYSKFHFQRYTDIVKVEVDGPHFIPAQLRTIFALTPNRSEIQ